MAVLTFICLSVRKEYMIFRKISMTSHDFISLNIHFILYGIYSFNNIHYFLFLMFISGYKKISYRCHPISDKLSVCVFYLPFYFKFYSFLF